MVPSAASSVDTVGVMASSPSPAISGATDGGIVGICAGSGGLACVITSANASKASRESDEATLRVRLYCP